MYGTFAVKTISRATAWVRAEVETGINTDAYVIACECSNALGLTQETRRPFAFAVQGGRRYRFVRGGATGTTEIILHYNTTDL